MKCERFKHFVVCRFSRTLVISLRCMTTTVQSSEQALCLVNLATP